MPALWECLSEILSQDDVNPVSIETQLFDYGNNTSQFTDFLDGQKQQQKAKFIFGIQFVAISDIVFHHPIYQNTSLDWKAWKLLEMYELTDIDDDNNKEQDSPLTPTFKHFLHVCEQTLDREAAEEISKLCKERVSGITHRKSSSRGNHSILSLSQEGDKALRIIKKPFLTIKREKSSVPITSPRKRGKTSKKIDTESLSFKRADSSSNIDALDLNSSVIVSNDNVLYRERKKIKRATRSGRFSTKQPLRTLSEVHFKELHQQFKVIANWEDVIIQNNEIQPKLLEKVEGYKIEMGNKYPTDDIWKNQTKFIEIIDSHSDFPFYEQKIANMVCHLFLNYLFYVRN